MSRGFLLPFTPIYAALAAARNRAYDQSLFEVRSLPATVVSVGNVSTGGTGKTPLVAALASLMALAGRTPIILSRGYGRTSTTVLRVDPDGAVERFGDEPLLLALTAPTYVGADRYRAGLCAAQENPVGPATVFLMDDGFQHRKLRRNIDIVLLSRSDLDDRLLPAGNLREPLSALSRADVLVFREQDAELAPQFLERFERPSCTRPVLWKVRRSLDLRSLPPDRGPALAFAGIARPSEFFASLRTSGIACHATLVYPDHHNYSFADITRIIATAKSKGATMLLTTEKDFVRLNPRARAALEALAPLYAIPLITEFEDPALCLRQIDALCVRQS